MDSLKEALLSAPDSQLDAQMKPLIRTWDNPPKAIQILEVLDYCIHGSLGSGFVVSLLQSLYDSACRNEGTTHDQVVLNAHWRRGL
jgi:hypothetical protein